MRHRKSGRKLGVTTKHRKAMFRNMATDLLRNGKINTTDTRAKEIRRVVEKLVTLGKNGSLHARRKALGYIRDRLVVEKLFSELAQRYMERPGGYTRIVKLGYRKGDNAPVSLIELVTEEYKAKRKRRKAKPEAKTESAAGKSSKKKSAEELGLVGEEEATKDQMDEQGEAAVAEAESPEPEEKADSSEKTGD
jgi:large subunit ribosomal protein L17